ncbi:hypothetical protein MVES1_000462 [Malassezia vespertilionis]|uniref:uncharacterized protein n=1 Tax=Malassezia vespertilionis TaxID=2020962 RepID=UPI0024B207C3|nr:uncharacterized protein MVES1_000462 [Malassezia vespertilionis]WFD05136.1 hypothetical protein MVES1_000462 [Malassezia vespertilionis]
MRATLAALQRTSVLCAQSTPHPLNDVQAVSNMLLAPLPLYRALLRAHRILPAEMRALGDDYIKAEFRRHQKIDNPLQIVAFCSQWKMYLDTLLANTRNPGQSLDSALLDKFSDEQLYQLYELKLATDEAFDPERAQDRPKKNGEGEGEGHA